MTPADRVTILAATLVALVAMGGVGYALGMDEAVTL